MHLIYMDDSRDEKLCVITALAVPDANWREALQTLKEFRRRIRASDGIFLYSETHAWKLVSGRGRISDRIVTKFRRSRILREFLATSNAMPGARLFNACFPAGQQARAMERLLNRVNRTLQNWGSYGLLFCDQGNEIEYTRLVRRMGVYNPIPSARGTWSDTGQRTKNIPTDRILEDPVFKKSEHSYFIQLVDCVAYALLRRENPLLSKNRYDINRAFSIVSPLLVRDATRYDPEGILRAP
jgi:hypothetical protein